jgi:hypothetical protein
VATWRDEKKDKEAKEDSCADLSDVRPDRKQFCGKQSVRGQKHCIWARIGGIPADRSLNGAGTNAGHIGLEQDKQPALGGDGSQCKKPDRGHTHKVASSDERWTLVKHEAAVAALTCRRYIEQRSYSAENITQKNLEREFKIGITKRTR